MATEMTREEAYEVYNRVRLTFPNRQLPAANFEGCPWFLDAEDMWCRQYGEYRMKVCVSRHGVPTVRVLFIAPNGRWYTSTSYADPAHGEMASVD